jgi:flagellar biogenesis protein FliO
MIPQDEDSLVEEPGNNRRGRIMVLVTLLLVLSMLATLIWPLLRTGQRRQPTPTPTPALLQEV